MLKNNKTSLWVANSMSQFLFFHFQVTNSKLENKKFHFTSSYLPKMEKQRFT